MPAKLTRKQIDEGLKAVPIEYLLLGAPSVEKRLTPKQREFAKELALGNTKAGAYRAAYNSKGKPDTQSRKGQILAKQDPIRAQVAALQLAEEARKHQTPAALRALVIERLTCHAIDDNIGPAQRLRALELLGKVTEVAAFTERREVVTHSDASALRDRLAQALRSALQSQATDAGMGASLLAELQPPALEVIDAPDSEPGQLGQAQPVSEELEAPPRESESAAQTDPPTPTPPNFAGAPGSA